MRRSLVLLLLLACRRSADEGEDKAAPAAVTVTFGAVFRAAAACAFGFSASGSRTANSSRPLMSSQFSFFALAPPIRTSVKRPLSFSPCRVKLSFPRLSAPSTGVSGS